MGRHSQVSRTPRHSLTESFIFNPRRVDVPHTRRSPLTGDYLPRHAAAQGYARQNLSQGAGRGFFTARQPVPDYSRRMG